MTDVVATYHDATAIKNVEEDLRSLGIPSEKIFIDKDNRKIRVTAPTESKAEVVEVLNRHKPAEIH